MEWRSHSAYRLVCCLSVNTITPGPLDIITKFSGHQPVVERADR